MDPVDGLSEVCFHAHSALFGVMTLDAVKDSMAVCDVLPWDRAMNSFSARKRQ
jgi:hypothetical protein